MKIKTFHIIIFILVLAGLTLAWVRHTSLQIPLWPGKSTPVWLIEARIDFVAQGQPVIVSLDIPDLLQGFAIVSEQAASSGYGFAIVEGPDGRRGEWTKRTATGLQTLYYKVQLVPDSSQNLEVLPQPPPKPRTVYWNDLQLTAAQQLVDQARSRSSTTISFARELIRQINASDTDQNASLLLTYYPLPTLTMRVLNFAGIPARLSMGLELEDARRHKALKPVLEIFEKDRWVPVDMETGTHVMPDNLLLWHRGGISLLDVIGGTSSEIRFSMIRQTMPSMKLAKLQHDGSGLSRISLFHLPIEEQSVLKMLLLLPVGALIVTFMRLIVGVRTAGTFMPVLIALAFLQTSLLRGLIAFLCIVSIGLLLRSYLSRLNLLMVARISTLIVLVIFLVSMISVIGYELGFNIGLTITFFPMVIIAWTIERMSILWEEEGSQEVFAQGLGSLCVAVLAYLCMSTGFVRHITFNFPEIHLVLLAIIMLMGQYTGYKLTELKRFGSTRGES
jgi:hypothetical protein